MLGTCVVVSLYSIMETAKYCQIYQTDNNDVRLTPLAFNVVHQIPLWCLLSCLET